MVKFCTIGFLYHACTPFIDKTYRSKLLKVKKKILKILRLLKIYTKNNPFGVWEIKDFLKDFAYWFLSLHIYASRCAGNCIIMHHRFCLSRLHTIHW